MGELYEDLKFYLEYKGSKETSRRNIEKLDSLLRKVCEKQRELCANNNIRDYDDSKPIGWTIDDTIDKILSAPKPTIINDK